MFYSLGIELQILLSNHKWKHGNEKYIWVLFYYSKKGIKISGSVVEEAKVLFFGDGVGLGFN